MRQARVGTPLSDVVAFFRGDEQRRQREHDYEAFHRGRLLFLIDLLHGLVPDARARVLDVGRSPLSYRLAARYREVVTLGFPLDQLRRDYPGLEPGEPTAQPSAHVVLDLNEFGQGRAIDPGAGTFDIVVFAETIEHLTTAPELVLAGLADVLRPGGILVCQTPNAAALHKRLKILFAYNPYERIRVDPTNPGHFREYTRAELFEIGRTVGLDVVLHIYKDDFAWEGSSLRQAAAAAMRLVSRIVPSFARGQTIVYRRPL